MKIDHGARQGQRSIRWIIFVAILLVVAVLAFALGAFSAQAANCPGRHVLALVDATTPYDDVDRARIMPAIEAMGMSLEPGDQLHIRTVAESAEASRLILDACVPDAGPWWQVALFGSDLSFFAQAGQTIEPVLLQRHEAPATALAETLAAYAPADEVWMFTDLLETRAVRVIELLEGKTRISIEVPNMDGVRVHVAGVGRFHDDMRRPLSVQEREGIVAAWRDWLAGAGAILRSAGEQ